MRERKWVIKSEGGKGGVSWFDPSCWISTVPAEETRWSTFNRTAQPAMVYILWWQAVLTLTTRAKPSHNTTNTRPQNDPFTDGFSGYLPANVRIYGLRINTETATYFSSSLSSAITSDAAAREVNCAKIDGWSLINATSLVYLLSRSFHRGPRAFCSPEQCLFFFFNFTVLFNAISQNNILY